MKKYTDNPLNVRLHHYQENKLNEMIKNETYCRKKGLYSKARKGELKNFTGIDSPYEPPLNPEIHIKSNELSAEEAADLIIKKLFT